MNKNITPGERLERIARLLVKAMYLCVDDREHDAPGGQAEPAVEAEDDAGYRSGERGGAADQGDSG